jgi:hypothetical protein
MTEIGASAPLPPPKDMREASIFGTLQDFFNRLVAILNRGISFSDNIDCKLVTYTSNAVADTQDTVAHTLGRTPSGFIVYDIDKKGYVYRSASSDATNLYLKTSVSSAAVKLIVF